MIVQNLDNKQSFLFSEVSRASQEEKAKKMLAQRAELWEWGAHTKGSLPFMLSNLRLPRGTPIYFFFSFLFFFFFFTRVTDFAKNKGTAPKLGRILWFINCFFSLQSTRAASLPTADGLSFSSKRKAGSSRHFKWEVHMHIYTRFLWHWIDRLSIKCLCILDCFGLKYHTHSAMENLYQPLIRLWAVLPFCLSSSRILKKSAKKS